MADYVRAIAPSVPPELVAPDRFAAIGAVAALLPAVLTNHFGFECRLGVADASADFTLMVSVAGGGRDILAGHHIGIPRPLTLLADPQWARARAFSTDWADPASPLYDGADFVCLEFDVAGDARRAAIPNVFFAQQRGDWIGDDTRADDTRMVRARATLERGVELLAGGPLAPATTAALHECFAALPAHAWAFQAGVMGARTPAPVRLQFKTLSPQEFLAFLGRIGWGGSMTELDALVTDLVRFTDDITYGVDLLEHGLGRKIGLECYIRDDMAHPDGPWPIFLDDLVARGWCLAAKRDALLAYPGISHQQTDAAAWPPSLTRAASLFGDHAIPVLTRYLHHVKIVFESEQAIEAKGYAGVAQRWVVRGA